MSSRLDDLAPEFKLKAFELLARCVEARIPVVIVETLRTQEQQDKNIAAGVSWTQHSKHLTGHAIDIALVAVLSIKGWAPDHPQWERIGKIGESLGLTWGGRWKRRDCPHFEINEA